MPCRLATAATGSRSASRMIATICSSENRPFRIAPSESGASLSTYRWSENPGAGQLERILRKALMAGKGYYSDRTFGTGHDDKLIDRQPPKDCVVRSRSTASLAPTGSEVTLDEIYR